MAALLVVAGWGATPPWAGPLLGLGVASVPGDVEIVTHAVPAVVVLAVAAFGLWWRLPLAAALTAVLAGLWMTATHAPLVGQAADGLVAWDAALFHSLPGLLVLFLALAAAVWAWRAEARAEVSAAPAKGSRSRRASR